MSVHAVFFLFDVIFHLKKTFNFIAKLPEPEADIKFRYNKITTREKEVLAWWYKVCLIHTQLCQVIR